jgi:hypothetical protein
VNRAKEETDASCTVSSCSELASSGRRLTGQDTAFERGGIRLGWSSSFRDYLGAAAAGVGGTSGATTTASCSSSMPLLR